MNGFCNRCGTEFRAGARFCGWCGAARTGALLYSLTPASELLQRWRQLARDLTRKEVRRLLGEPLALEFPRNPLGEVQEVWIYSYAEAAPVSPATVETATDIATNRLISAPAAARTGPESGRVWFALPDGRAIRWEEPMWPADPVAK